MSEVNWSDNPEIVRAHLTGEEPDPEVVAYLEEEVCGECGGAVKDIREHISCLDARSRRP